MTSLLPLNRRSLFALFGGAVLAPMLPKIPFAEPAPYKVVQKTGLFTYAEWARRQNLDGKASVLVEMLSKNNEFLEDMFHAP